MKLSVYAILRWYKVYLFMSVKLNFESNFLVDSVVTILSADGKPITVSFNSMKAFNSGIGNHTLFYLTRNESTISFANPSVQPHSRFYLVVGKCIPVINAEGKAVMVSMDTINSSNYAAGNYVNLAKFNIFDSFYEN